MGNPIEDGMSDWHDTIGVPASQSDKQFYKDLGDKYNYPNYGQRTDHNFKSRFPRDEELDRIRATGNKRDYWAYVSAKKESEMGTKYYRQEYVELFDTTGEHTGTGKWGWRDDLEMSITNKVPKRRRYKVKNPYWIGPRD